MFPTQPYWKEITDDIYTKDSDNKYYYRYQNDVPAQTQHFYYNFLFIIAINCTKYKKIDWGDKP